MLTASRSIDDLMHSKYTTVTFTQFHDDSSMESELENSEETIEINKAEVQKPDKVPNRSMPPADSDSYSIAECEGTPPKTPKLKTKIEGKSRRSFMTNKAKGSFQIVHHIIPTRASAKDTENKPRKGYSTDLDDMCTTIEHLQTNLRIKVLSDGTDVELYKLKEVESKIKEYMKEVMESENSEKAKANDKSVLWCILCNIFFLTEKAKTTHF